MTATHDSKVTYCLSLSSKAGDPIGGRYEVNGLPARKFRKELIRVGKFVHPTTGVEFEVDGNTLDDWVTMFVAMSADGIDVPLTTSHANTVDESRGFIRDMFREGDSLYGIVECIGEDALSAAARTNTSIYATSNCKSGNGKSYPWAIQHVALTNKPVVPGLKPFETIAASADGQPIHILSLAIGDEAMPDPALDAPEVNPKDAVRKSFKAIMMKLWDDESVELPQWVGKVKELRKKQIDVLVKLGPDEEAEEKPPEETPPAGSEVAPAVVAASNDPEPSKINPAMVSLLADNRLSKLALSVQAGEITPAASEKLKEMFVGKDNVKVVLALSNDDAPDAFEDTLAAVKAQGPAIKPGENTPGQVLSLSNPANKPAEANALVANAEKRAKAAKS